MIQIVLITINNIMEKSNLKDIKKIDFENRTIDFYGFYGFYGFYNFYINPLK